MTTQGFKGSRGCGLLSLKQHDLCPSTFWLRPLKWASVMTLFWRSAANSFHSIESKLLCKNEFYWVIHHTVGVQHAGVCITSRGHTGLCRNIKTRVAVQLSRCYDIYDMTAWLSILVLCLNWSDQTQHKHLWSSHQHFKAEERWRMAAGWLSFPFSWILLGTFLVNFAQCLGLHVFFAIKGQSFWSGLPKDPSCFAGEHTDRTVVKQW